MRVRRVRAWALASLAVLALSPAAKALSASEAQKRAQVSIQNVRDQLRRVSPRIRASATLKKPEEYIASADLHLHARYAGALNETIDDLNKVVELYRQGKASPAANADANYMLGEAYFKSGQLLSARRYFREVLALSGQSAYAPYAGRSLSRLVDIALERGDLESLDEVFARLAQLPGSDPSGSLQYARAKALFVKGDYGGARAAVNSVPASSSFTYQAQYLLGVVMMKEAGPPPAAVESATGKVQPAPQRRFAAAIEQFSRVARLPSDSAMHGQVTELAWMAIGRLLYESGSYPDAAEAYRHVGQKSTQYSRMLYELAWVYVRLGDYKRALQSLELYSSGPDIQDRLEGADVALLTADLMLRSGRFKPALEKYDGVRGRFDPIRAKVDNFLALNTDPAIYYDKLTQENSQIGKELPPAVLKWARDVAEQENAFSMIEDVNRSRELIRRARELVARLRTVLGSPTRARAFPQLRLALAQTLALLNQIGQARYALAQGMDDVAGSVGGELGRVRQQRRALMGHMSKLPVAEADFTQREATGEQQWNKVSQELQRQALEADRLQAILKGLDRVLKEADQFGVSRDPATRQRFKAEIEANRRDLEGYRQRLDALRRDIEAGRVRVGFGDQRYAQDDAVRGSFKSLFAREVELCAGGADRDAMEYARAIRGILSNADAVELELTAIRNRQEGAARSTAQTLLSVVEEEAKKIADYQGQLGELDQSARVQIGELAMRSFASIRDRLKKIVLHADVGIAQQAWEVREEQRIRVRDLQRERAQEERKLNDELREVLDDAEVP